MKVLVSAFACYPPTTESCTDEDKKMADGEAILSWNLIGQIARSHDVWVITQARNKNGIERAFIANSVNRVTFVYCDLRGWTEWLWNNQISNHLYYYLWQILAYQRARRLHGNIHFDLAHHITFANDWMPSFIGAFLPIPFIWGPIGGGHKTPKALLREYTFAQRLGDKFRLVAQWVGRNVLVSRRLCQKRAKAILVCNYETRNKIPPHLRHKAHMFPVNSLSENNIQESRLPISKNEIFRILSVGRLRPLKGFGLAIKAYSEFSKKYPQSIFEIIGDGIEESRLKSLTKQLKVDKRVIFSPWLPRNEVMRRMNYCDVFLFPSFREGGGAVIVEAMANGKPVIGLATGGPAFHIQPEWGIKIIPSAYDQILADIVTALERLYLDSNLRLSLGKAALQRAKDYYLLDRLGEKLEFIYKQALS
jgi:glycosyltransferase involved in cell wall biosynthesis